MSVNYYMVCPECKRYAIVYRYTFSGNNPPNGHLVHDFFMAHSGHKGFVPACHEQEGIMDDDTIYDGDCGEMKEGWVEMETYAEGGSKAVLKEVPRG